MSNIAVMQTDNFVVNAGVNFIGWNSQDQQKQENLPLVRNILLVSVVEFIGIDAIYRRVDGFLMVMRRVSEHNRFSPVELTVA